MDSYPPFGPTESEILPERMSGLYRQQPQGQQQPHHPQQQFASVQQRDQQYQQAAKSAIQSQAGASLMAPFHPQGGPMQGGMNGPGGPAMGTPGAPGAMNVPGAMGGQGGPAGMGVPGGPMGGAPGMNVPGGPRRIVNQQRPGSMPMNAMNIGNVGMGMRPGMQTRMMNPQMGPNLSGQGGMLAGQGGMSLGQGGMPGQGNMPLGGQGNMSGLAGQGNMSGMSGLGGPNGMHGPGAMSSMGNGPNGMSMGNGSNMPGLGGQGGMSALGSQPGMSGLGTQNLGAQGGMGGMSGGISMGAGGGMSSLAGGGGMGAQPGGLSGLPGQGGLGNGPGGMGPGNGGPGGPGGMGAPGGMGGMSSMNLNGLGPSGGPGMSGANGLPGANGMQGSNARQWSIERQYVDDMNKRPTSAQLDDFGGLPGTGQHGIGGGHPGGPQHGGPQHSAPHGQPGVGGPPHGVGGSGQHGPQHGMGAPQQQQPPQHAGSPVNGLPAHHPQHHPVPTHIGQAPPGHMGQSGTPRMATTPAHPGGPPHMATAPSPHHMGGSPAHHQGHPHQPPHHLVGSPAHMGSPRHMTSSSPAPGSGPHPPRSGAPTPVPPRGTSADPMMGMRPEGLGRPDGLRIGGEQGMMRMNEGMMIRGPDGQIRPANEVMMRDGRMMRDGMLPIERAPSADGMPRPGMRPEIGRLGPDGTMIRGQGPVPYGQPPPYGVQGPGFGQPAPPGYVLHQTPAQQHQNMQIRNNGGGGSQRSGSVDEMPILSGQMSLPDEMGDMVPTSGPPGRRTSMPPQMAMMNGVGPGPGPRPSGPGAVPGPVGPGMVMPQRRPTISHPQQPRLFPIGMGIVRLLQMSQEMSETHPKSLEHWIKFRNEYFMMNGRISMTVFDGVEGRKYDVAPELIARFFLTFFESGVSKMSLDLTGAKETSDDPDSLDSVVETLSGVWRYEINTGWVVEQAGPIKVFMTAVMDQGLPGEQQQPKLKIREMIFTAPKSWYLFRTEQLQGNLVSGPTPMTPRISPGLAARKTEGGNMDDLSGNTGREEEILVYENVRFPPKPFQKFGLPENVWRLLVMSTSVHELFPLMDLAHESQSGPIAALEHYAEMDQNARMQVGLPNFLPDDLGPHQFPNFTSDFGGPGNMLSSSPGLTHPHPGMHNQGSIATTGRPTPTPPLSRQTIRNGQQLAGSGELPPVPGLSVPGPGPGMMVQQSPSMGHPLPPGQQPNGQGGMKRKHQPPDQGPDAGGPSGATSQPRGVANSRVKSSPVVSRKKAKTNAPPG
ncbi:hypothetical protein FRC07_003729 [Ceratobasidium sp. 392]|nr:hypothetical protein FRC07_003729 [Ceratobasidium sp. 392]